MLRYVCYFLLSSMACLLVAKLVVGYTLLPLDQQKPAVARLELESDTTTVRYCDSKTFVKAEFKIRNRGDKRLTVTAREFNCKCHLGRAGSIVVPPGEVKTMSLPMSMPALAHRPDIRLTLFTNDPDQPMVPMSVKVIDRPPLVPAGAVSVLQD